MDNNVNSEESQTCAPDWSAGVVNPKNGSVLNASLTSLGYLDGTMPFDTQEGSVYGAEFMPVEMHTPYYDRMLTATVEVPWLAEPEEGSYLNRLKEMNEPPVQTYKELELKPVNQNINETVEGFNNLKMNYVVFLKVILIVVLIAWIYKLSKNQ